VLNPPYGAVAAAEAATAPLAPVLRPVRRPA